MKPRILFVDDEQNILDGFRRSLREQSDEWEMEFKLCPFEAMTLLMHERFDAVVTDVCMPAFDGLAMLERMQSRSETSDIPVVIVTGESSDDLRRRALEQGAADLLRKPIDRLELLARLRSVLKTKACVDQLRHSNEQLEERVRQRTAELEASRIEIVMRLAKASEWRDEDTGNHVLRVGCYSRIIAETMMLDEAYVENIFLAAPLHDVGKIGIPDSILRKAGRLTGSEWRLMKTHCAIGASILKDDSRLLSLCRRACWNGEDLSLLANPLLQMASEIALGHHEQWDGAGYPKGLRGTGIPLSARIVAVVDVFDALRSARPYKPSFTLDRTLEIMHQQNESHFDPGIFAAFEASLGAILRVEAELGEVHDSQHEGGSHAQRLVC